MRDGIRRTAFEFWKVRRARRSRHCFQRHHVYVLFWPHVPTYPPLWREYLQCEEQAAIFECGVPPMAVPRLTPGVLLKVTEDQYFEVSGEDCKKQVWSKFLLLQGSSFKPGDNSYAST